MEFETGYLGKNGILRSLSGIGQFQSRGEFCDIIVRCCDGDVPTSSLVLSAVSPMLCAALRETPQIDEWVVIVPESAKSEVELLLFMFFHLGPSEVEEKRLENVMALLDIRNNYKETHTKTDSPEKVMANNESQHENMETRKLNLLQYTQQNFDASEYQIISDDEDDNFVIDLDNADYCKPKTIEVVLRKLEPEELKEDIEPRVDTEVQMSLNTKPRIKIFCAECGQDFKTNGELKIHIKTHSQINKGFVCPHCGNAFASRGSMDVHIIRIHVAEKTHRCPVESCHKMFKTVGEVKQHQKTHSNAKDFICTTCGSSYASKQQLQNHCNLLHAVSPDGYFHCGECEAIFKTPLELRTHDRRTHHVPEKKFRCDVCGKAFSVLCNLQRHLMMHSDERPFSCPDSDCGARFRTKYHYQKHYRTHMKGQSHNSRKRFPLPTLKNDNLPPPQHQIELLPEKFTEMPFIGVSFMCLFCNANFHEQDQLKQHVLKLHGEQLESQTEFDSNAGQTSILR